MKCSNFKRKTFPSLVNKLIKCLQRFQIYANLIKCIKWKMNLRQRKADFIGNISFSLKAFICDAIDANSPGNLIIIWWIRLIMPFPFRNDQFNFVLQSAIRHKQIRGMFEHTHQVVTIKSRCFSVMKYGLLFIVLIQKSLKQKSLSHKFIWQRPIYSFHCIERSGREGRISARQLYIFDAVLSPSIRAEAQTERFFAWTCVLWLNKQFYVLLFGFVCFRGETIELYLGLLSLISVPKICVSMQKLVLFNCVIEMIKQQENFAPSVSWKLDISVRNLDCLSR